MPPRTNPSQEVQDSAPHTGETNEVAMTQEQTAAYAGEVLQAGRSAQAERATLEAQNRTRAATLSQELYAQMGGKEVAVETPVTPPVLRELSSTQTMPRESIGAKALNVMDKLDAGISRIMPDAANRWAERTQIKIEQGFASLTGGFKKLFAPKEVATTPTTPPRAATPSPAAPPEQARRAAAPTPKPEAAAEKRAVPEWWGDYVKSGATNPIAFSDKWKAERAPATPSAAPLERKGPDNSEYLAILNANPGYQQLLENIRETEERIAEFRGYIGEIKKIGSKLPGGDSAPNPTLRAGRDPLHSNQEGLRRLEDKLRDLNLRKPLFAKSASDELAMKRYQAKQGK